MNVSQDLSILHLILNASAVVQAIMLLLAGLSFMSWYYIFRKWFTVREAHHSNIAFGADYALTLKIWRKRFMARLDEVREQGFDERFIRTWEFYLAYCEAAFEHGSTDVWQYVLTHAGA